MTIAEYHRLKDDEIIRHTKVMSDLEFRLKMTQTVCKHEFLIEHNHQPSSQQGVCKQIKTTEDVWKSGIEANEEFFLSNPSIKFMQCSVCGLILPKE